MGSKARSVFIEGISALEMSVNSSLVSGADTIGSFLRRGLQVVGYGLLETFIVDRLGELSDYINGGISHVADLPEKLQRAAFQETLRIAADKMQWVGADLSDILTFSSQLGSSLAAASGPIRLSPLTWQWRGSNMGVDDLARALRLFHVKAPWLAMTDMGKRLDFPVLDAKAAAAGLLRERNSSAHDSTYQVSNLISRAAPVQILAIGCVADIFMSIAAHCLKTANQGFLGDQEWLTADKVKLRFVRARTRDWAEMVEGKTRAVRIDVDSISVFKKACTAAMGKIEVVVLQDQKRKVLDWTYPDAP